MRTIFSYGPDATSTTLLHVVGIPTSGAVRGRDTFLSLLNYSPRYVGVIETGECQVAPDEQKVLCHSLWLRTYVETGTVAPDVTIAVKSIKDTSWRVPGSDTQSTISVTSTACSQTGGAFCNTIGTGDSSTVAFTTPCQAKQARYYLDGVETTAFTTSGTTVTFTTAPGTGVVITAYWQNQPHIYTSANDYIETSQGFHRILALPDYDSATLEWYPDSSLGTLTGTHWPAHQLPEGEGETVMGLGRLNDAFLAKIILIPRDSSSSYENVRVLGFTVVYSSAGPRQNRA